MEAVEEDVGTQERMTAADEALALRYGGVGRQQTWAELAAAVKVSADF